MLTVGVNGPLPNHYFVGHLPLTAKFQTITMSTHLEAMPLLRSLKLHVNAPSDKEAVVSPESGM